MCLSVSSVAPFNSMKDRDAAFSNENPGKYKSSISLTLSIGPGTYAQEKVKVVGTVKDMMSNSFTTKVSKREA